ncbi:30S ribosomal protein S20 [bacterium]|nr:30S ribosomal protein S20 [bacterium]
MNQMRRTRVKSLTKEVFAAVEAGDREAAQDALGKAVPVIQRAASRGTFHRNTASRKISRLSKRVNTIPSDSPSEESSDE